MLEKIKELILTSKKYLLIEEEEKGTTYDIYDKRGFSQRFNIYIPDKEVTLLDYDNSTGSYYEVERERMSEGDFNYLMKEMKKLNERSN